MSGIIAKQLCNNWATDLCESLAYENYHFGGMLKDASFIDQAAAAA